MSAHAEHHLQRLLAEETFVRDLAQQLVAGDADEVVQQTWLHAVQQGGRGIERPRHWLARIVRNLAANLRRDDRRRRERLRTIGPHDLVPSSAELAEREECRRALVAAVDALPPPLRTVVLLRWFEGQPPRRIAAALGVPAATVSTQLQRALALLRQRLDAAHGGDRRAWLVPLVPFVVRPELPLAGTSLPVAAATAGPALVLGAIAMTTKSKFAAAAAVLLVGASAWMLWLGQDTPAAPLLTDAAVSPPALVQTPPGALTPADATTRREVVVPAPGAAATTGTVIVHVRYGDDRSSAAGTMLTLHRPGGDPRYEGRRQRTDAEGAARYDDVPPGRHYVSNEPAPGKRFDLAAGQTVEIEIELAVGLTVNGIVVDAARRPVAGAQVEVTMVGHALHFPDVVARTGADGRFAARACPIFCLVGARAFGHTASTVKSLLSRNGNTADVELVLGPGGGAVDGTVVDVAGKAIADAVVIVGAGKLSGIGGRDHLPPFPALARSDPEGEFLAIGIPAGEQPLRLRAPGFVPWAGKCSVVAGTTVTQRIVLEAGSIIHGSVRDAEGKAVGRAAVEIGNWGDLAHVRTLSAPDGSFELTGLPSGEVELRAEHADFGKARQRVVTAAAAPASVDVLLSRGLELKGRVVDPDGQPVADAMLDCEADAVVAARWSTVARGDAQGRFVVANCPEAGTIGITVRARGFAEFRQTGIDPKAPDLELQLQREAPSTVRFIGRVVGPDGKPVANAAASARRQDARGSTGVYATDNAGRFELGPVPTGVWRVSVRSPLHPEFCSEPRELAADASWDCGTITLVHGGTARMRLLGPAIPGATFHIADAAHTGTWGIADEAGGRRTNPLAPGDYALLVSGTGAAAMAVPFAIRASVEVVVDVQLQPGVAQRFRCELPAGANGDGVSLRVLCGDAFVGHAWASLRGEQTAELWLAAGDYTVFAEAGALRGFAKFTVGAASGVPVAVTLR